MSAVSAMGIKLRMMSKAMAVSSFGANVDDGSIKTVRPILLTYLWVTLCIPCVLRSENLIFSSLLCYILLPMRLSNKAQCH